MPITITLTLSTLPKRSTRHGFVPDRRQRYKCKTCGQQHRQHPRINTYSEQEIQRILNAQQERFLIPRCT